jgi:hypothetical protein
VLALNIAYRTGSGSGRTAASFLVGRQLKSGEKLAPLRTDQGPRTLTDVTVRRLDRGVRR